MEPRAKGVPVRHDRVIALGLNSRIVDEPASNSGCPGASGENLLADARAASRQRCLHPLLDAGIPWQMTALQSNSSYTETRK